MENREVNYDLFCPRSFREPWVYFSSQKNHLSTYITAFISLCCPEQSKYNKAFIQTTFTTKQNIHPILYNIDAPVFKFDLMTKLKIYSEVRNKITKSRHDYNGFLKNKLYGHGVCCIRPKVSFFWRTKSSILSQ